MPQPPTARIKPDDKPRRDDPATTLQLHIERLETQFETLRQQVRQTHQLASLGTAAAMMAHEFNNLMCPVVGFARMALDAQDVELMQKALNLTLKHLAIMSGVSDRVLGLAAHEAQVYEPSQLKCIVEESVACLVRDPAKDGISIKLDVPDDLMVRADDKQIIQVLFNLLLNARAAIEHGNGRIVIAASQSAENKVLLTVRDNGCGIDPEHIDSIFDPFFTTKKKPRSGERKGSGLGLAICSDIIKEHGGTIAVESQVGEGTCFTITLPLAD